MSSLQADLAATVRHRVPLVITSLGILPEVIAAVQSYGGLVFHDVTTIRHARKAVEGGVDGLIAVCAGAGGHAGRLSPFAFLPELRAFYQGPLLMGGAISTGRQIAAALMLGADMAYMGTRFIAVRESMAAQAHKDMVVQARAADIVYTPAISGVHANFLRPSLRAAGLDPDTLPEAPSEHVGDHDKRPWKNIWSAGQGVGAVNDIPGMAELIARLGAEYREALRGAAMPPDAREAGGGRCYGSFMPETRLMLLLSAHSWVGRVAGCRTRPAGRWGGGPRSRRSGTTRRLRPPPIRPKCPRASSRPSRISPA